MKTFNTLALIIFLMIPISLTAQKTVFKDIDGKSISKEEFQTKYKDTIKYHREYTMSREKGKTVVKLKAKNEESYLKKQNKEFTKRFFYKEMPEFKFTDTKGNQYSNESLKGKTVVLNFWFAKCGPSLKKYLN